LETWQKLNQDEKWLQAKTLPWWYNERATLGLFAGAIWLSQGIVLEEFSTRKNAGRTYRGRSDIKFALGESWFLAEAKQCWPKFKRQPHIRQKAKELLGQAGQDVTHVNCDCDNRLGIVFITPQIRKAKISQIDHFVQECIKQLLEIDGTMIAWTFTQDAKDLTSPWTDYGEWIFPGVVIVLKPFKL